MKIYCGMVTAAFLICLTATSPGCTGKNNAAAGGTADAVEKQKGLQSFVWPMVQVATEGANDVVQPPAGLSIASVDAALGTLTGLKLADVRDFLNFIGVQDNLMAEALRDQEAKVIKAERSPCNLDDDPESELLIHVTATHGDTDATENSYGLEPSRKLNYELHIIAVIDADDTGARPAGAQGMYFVAIDNPASVKVRTAHVRTTGFEDVTVEYGDGKAGEQGTAVFSRTFVFGLLDGKMTELLDTYGAGEPEKTDLRGPAGLRMEIGDTAPATATWFDAATSGVLYRKAFNTTVGAYMLMPELSPEDLELESRTSDSVKRAEPVCPENGSQELCGRWGKDVSFPTPTNGFAWQISCSRHTGARHYSWALAACLRATATAENAGRQFADKVRSQIAGIANLVDDDNLLNFFSSFGGIVHTSERIPDFSGVTVIDGSDFRQDDVFSNDPTRNPLIRNLLGGGSMDIVNACRKAGPTDQIYQFCEPWQRNNEIDPEKMERLREAGEKGKVRR